MSENLPYIIRHATERDVPQLWQLMRELAIFERYIDRFCVTEEIIRKQGFQKEHPDFHALVAENVHTKELGAMLVYYFIPFTVTARPTLFIKELYVAEHLRRKGIGKILFDAIKKEAAAAHCSNIQWKVAPWNQSAIRFYEREGAKPNNDWIDYEIKV
ncbi:MAG: GNAT family N-acetyltransferase [Cytophagales bacterium]|nr:GNAT family N-acetyltransferase [Bernardetiaceae bacterium]MDW8205592.1 GNAT family N-acetyltransferase [Cytophagales bacterium]